MVSLSAYVEVYLLWPKLHEAAIKFSGRLLSTLGSKASIPRLEELINCDKQDLLVCRRIYSERC